MRSSLVVTGLCIALAGQAQAQATEPPMLRGAEALEWHAVAAPQGAIEAVLWEDSSEGDRAVLVRWTFNTKVPPRVRAQDLHLVVLAGTLTVEVDGEYTEFGPGGFATVPGGTEHALGCAATGQCTFLMHHSASTVHRDCPCDRAVGAADPDARRDSETPPATTRCVAAASTR